MAAKQERHRAAARRARILRRGAGGGRPDANGPRGPGDTGTLKESKMDIDRKQARPGFYRISLDVPEPMYKRLRAFVEAHKVWGASEQQVCRTFLDEGLTNQGYPADQQEGQKAKGRRKRKPKS